MSEQAERIGQKTGRKPKYSSVDSAKKAKREQDRLIAHSRIVIGDQKGRWDRLKDEKKLQTNGDVAKFLLDIYYDTSKELETCNSPAVRPKDIKRNVTPVRKSPRHGNKTVSPILPNASFLSTPTVSLPIQSTSSPFLGILKPFSPGGILHSTSKRESSRMDITGTQTKARKSLIQTLQNETEIHDASEYSLECYSDLSSDLDLVDDDVSSVDLSDDSDDGSEDENNYKAAQQYDEEPTSDTEPLEDDLNDPDYIPSYQAENVSAGNCKFVVHDNITPEAFSREQLYHVQKSCLLSLASQVPLKVCSEERCKRPVSVKIVDQGTTTARLIIWECSAGHCCRSWCSQAIVGGKVHFGDLKLSASVLLSGNNIAKINLFHQFAGVPKLSNSLYFGLQRNVIIPVVDETFADLVREAVEKGKDRKIIVCGDARNDSPGHCAMYSTYTLMDHSTLEILAMHIVDKRHTGGKSGLMEIKGFKTLLDSLLDQGLDIVEVVTDQHPQIIKYMRDLNQTRINEGQPTIFHSFDLWHVSKNLGKKLSAAAKEKHCKGVSPWVHKICNQLFKVATKCNGSMTLFKDLWKGVLHHIQGKHMWLDSQGNVVDCGHRDGWEEKEEILLIPGSKALGAVQRIIFSQRFLKIIPFIVRARSTSQLETFHDLILKYCGKRFSFKYEAYRARNRLAALDYQANLQRKQSLNKKGELMWNRKVNKMTGKWTVSKVMEPKQYEYIYPMMENIALLSVEAETSVYDPLVELTPTHPQRISRNVSGVVPVPTAEIVAEYQKRQRFKVEDESNEMDQ